MHYPWLPAQVAENQLRQEANQPNSCVQTAVKSRLKEMENAANSVVYTSVQNVDLQVHKVKFYGRYSCYLQSFP
jgi:hypothetical protein